MKPHLLRAFTLRYAGALAVSLLCLGCEAAAPIVPTPIPTPVPSPERSFSLQGVVSDTASRVLVGARIEVLDGPRAGTVTATDEHGHFTLSGTFTGTVRLMASQDGFLSQTNTYAIAADNPGTGSANLWAPFYLELPGPSAQILGDFSVTLTADASCTGLPETVRTRRYTTTIGNGSRTHAFEARLNGGQFFTWVRCSLRDGDCLLNRIWLGTAGDSVGGYMMAIEQVADTSYLIVDGEIEGRISSTGVTASLNGSLDFCPAQPVEIEHAVWACRPGSEAFCHSTRHRIELIRH